MSEENEAMNMNRELSKLKKKRTGHRNVVFKRLAARFASHGIDEISEEGSLQLLTVLQTLKEKALILKELDEQIINIIEEDDIEREVDLSTQIDTDL